MQRCAIYISLLLITFTNIQSKAQSSGNKADSLRSELERLEEQSYDYGITLLRLSNAIASQQPKMGTSYAEEAVAIGKSIEHTWLTSLALKIQGVSYLAEDRYGEAMQSFSEAVAVLNNDQDEEKNPTHLGNCYNNMALVYKHLGDYPSSLAYHAKAEKEYIKAGYETGIARTNNNLGNLYKLQGELPLAEAAFKKALTIHNRLNNHKSKVITQMNLGYLYRELKDYHQAQRYLDSALVYCNQYNDLARKVGVLIGFGKLSLAQIEDGTEKEPQLSSSYTVAEEYFLSAITYAEELSMPDSKAEAMTFLARLEANRGNIEKSKAIAQQAKEFADATNTFGGQSNAEEILAYVYEKAGEWQVALKHYQRYKAWQDSIYNEQKAALYKSQQVQMEVAGKDREIANQTNQVALLNERVALETRLKWTLGAASFLLMLAGLLYYQKYQTRKKYAQRIETSSRQLEEVDATVNYFADSLFGKNAVDEILWDVAKNCISRLGLEDCVIYLLDSDRNVLIQKAAYGPKNPKDFTIQDPIEIPFGSGIVGTVAQTGQPEVIQDTTRDERYIVDDEVRLSELAVPIKHQGKVIGVIDSEHQEKDFFTEYHLRALQTISALCGTKIAQALADKEVQKAEAVRKEAKELKAMDLMKSRFFANISHEFRTPLHLIIGTLHDNDEGISTSKRDMMQRNAQRLLRLVNQLMDLSKLEVGQMHIEYQSADIFAFLQEVATAFVPLAEQKEISYQVDIPPRPYPVRFDADKLEKIVYNLLSNAIKFTPDQGRVSLHAGIESPCQLRLSVSDTGLGIPQKLQSKIFDRFYQADDSDTRAFEGTGIGLALVKELVDLHGGTIRVDSQVHQGATFVVLLPLQPVEEEPLVTPIVNLLQGLPTMDTEKWVEPENEVSGSESELKPLLLVVEDNEDLRRYLYDHLREEFNCQFATNGKEGLVMATEQVHDLIVTDIMMPEMDGVELTKRLKADERTSHIPILMLTARDDTPTKRAGFQEGADQYLIKPFEIDELFDRLQGLLKQRNRIREKYLREVKLGPSEVTITDRDGAFIERCIQAIEEQISNPAYSVDQLQREVGMSDTQLNRKMKALVNLSPVKFIRDIRLQRAAQLLKKNSGQVAEVAYEVGFNHLSYFAKSFKEKFGMTPSEYVNQSDNPV